MFLCTVTDGCEYGCSFWTYQGRQGLKGVLTNLAWCSSLQYSCMYCMINCTYWKSLVAFCRFFYIFIFINRVYIQYLYILLVVKPLLISSWLPVGRGPPLGCRAEIRTRACRTASRRTHCYLSYACLVIIFFLLKTQSQEYVKGQGNEADFLWLLQKLVPHRSLTLPFEPFRFWLRIRGDIRNRKPTRRVGESTRLPIDTSVFKLLNQSMVLIHYIPGLFLAKLAL